MSREGMAVAADVKLALDAFERHEAFLKEEQELLCIALHCMVQACVEESAVVWLANRRIRWVQPMYWQLGVGKTVDEWSTLKVCSDVVRVDGAVFLLLRACVIRFLNGTCSMIYAAESGRLQSTAMDECGLEHCISAKQLRQQSQGV